MVGQEAVGFIGVHEVVVGKPSDGSPDAAPVGELVPPWEQMRIFLVEFVLEPAECAAAPDRAGQSVAGPLAEGSASMWTRSDSSRSKSGSKSGSSSCDA